MFQLNFSLLYVATAIITASISAQQGADYLDSAPATVYEDTVMSPQNLDFDATNNMFVAHSGWYNDKLIHYYKFRIFAPDTYPDVIQPDGSSAQVPVQKIFFVTTTGDFDGVLGMPIIEYHTADGVLYSDFMNVVFVMAPSDYTADTFQSVGDVEASGAEMMDTDIVLNIPVVPTGSTLQDPMLGGTNAAPIQPTMVFYRGTPVQTFVFEVTSEDAAMHFANTRSGDGSSVARDTTLITGFEIPIVAFASPDFVSAIPLWHVNQFSNGVMEGMGGGPNPAGMRNVINLDRTDAGYSPLWNLLWGTAMPINYSADQFSNAMQGTVDNGFEFFTTPVYVNCPDIGLVGEEINPLKLDSFQTDIMLGELTSFTLIGTSPNLIFQANQTIMFVAIPSNTTIGETTTNMMGGYEYDLEASDIPDGTTEVSVVYDGESIRTIMVENMMGSNNEDGNGGSGDDSSSSSGTMMVRFLPRFVVGVVVSMTAMMVV